MGCINQPFFVRELWIMFNYFKTQQKIKSNKYSPKIVELASLVTMMVGLIHSSLRGYRQ